MGSREHVQRVIRRVACPRCGAKPGEQCISGRQYDGRYVKSVPNSHMTRWKAAIDAGHVPDQLSDLK